MSAQNDLHTQALQSPVFRMQKGGDPDASPSAPAQEEQPRVLNSWLEKFKEEEPHNCAGLPEHVITQIYNAVNNSITALEDRDQGEIEDMRREIFTVALNNAQSLAKQVTPTGEKCPRWNQVVSGSVRIAQQATNRASNSSSTKVGHRNRHQETKNAENPTGPMKAPPLPEDSFSLKLMEGADVGNGVPPTGDATIDPTTAALIAAGVIGAGALAAHHMGSLEISNTQGPVGNPTDAMDDPFHFQRKVLQERGLPIPAQMQRKEAIIRPHPATLEATADRSDKASAKFQERIEAQREQDALAPKELGASA
jgi:hypothetical protein